MKSDRRFVTADELAKRYGVRPTTIKAWAGRERIPAVRMSARTIRFDAEACDRALCAASSGAKNK